MKHFSITRKTPIRHLAPGIRRGLSGIALLIFCVTSCYAVPITISGNVYNDGDGGTISGTPISVVSTNQLYVYLIDNSNTIIDRGTVAATTGAYSITGSSSTNYNVSLSSSFYAISSSNPNLGLPNSWVPTAEGVTSAGDGTPDLGVAINSNSSIVVNFAIDARPDGNSYFITSPTFVANQMVIIPKLAFTGSDPEDGNYLPGFPGRSIDLYQALGGDLYYNGSLISFSSANVATRINNFDTALLRFKFVPGLTHSFAYSTVDNAGTPELVPNTVALSFPLPVVLDGFSGSAEGADIKLLWQTSSEAMNAGFNIQRSDDGTHFATIGYTKSLASGGYSKTPLAYSYMDYGANATDHPQYIYRLMQIDADGRASYSNPVWIAAKSSAGPLQVYSYPNPSTGVLSLDANTGNSQDEMLKLYVLGGTGSIVMTKTIPSTAGRLHTTLDLSSLPGGNYYIRVTGNNGMSRLTPIVLMAH